MSSDPRAPFPQGRRSHGARLLHTLRWRRATPQARVGAWLGLFLGFWAMSWTRLQLVNRTVGEYSGCTQHCFDRVVFASDALVFAVLMAAVGLACVMPRPVRALLAALGLLLLTCFAVDIFVFDLLNNRLNLPDILRYAGDVRLNSTVALPTFGSGRPLGLLLLAGLSGLSLLWLTLKPPQSRARAPGLWPVLLLPLLLGMYAEADEVGHIAADSYRDLITINLPSGEDQAYSLQRQTELARLPAPATQCLAPPTPHPRPVILLVVESLSLYHSQALSGLGHELPQLDELAQKYSHIESFYANGFTTDGGLIALLTGHVPLPTVHRYQSFNAYQGFENDRHQAFKQLHAAGISSWYFRTADLGFLNSGAWLRHLGFDHVEGPESPFYQALPRGSFNEPGDHALYQRFVHWYDNERANDRFFTVLQTTTTHPPFRIPGQPGHSENEAFRYADREIGRFVQALEQRHFFDRGLLVITGDHRSMTVRRPGEQALLGMDAPARIPAILLGAEFRQRGPLPGRWQQTDFLPSLLAANGLRSCTDALTGRFLGPSVEPDVILHAQGLTRDRVLVRLRGQDQPREIALDGDRTRWITPPPSDPLDVVQEINRQRAMRPEAPENFTENLLRWYGLKS